jgi:hypothetical protein
MLLGTAMPLCDRLMELDDVASNGLTLWCVVVGGEEAFDRVIDAWNVERESTLDETICGL